MVSMAMTGRPATTARDAGGVALVSCSACPAVTLGRWEHEHGRPVFRPDPHAVRGVVCGDGWVAMRCRRCGRRIELAYGTTAA